MSVLQQAALLPEECNRQRTVSVPGRTAGMPTNRLAAVGVAPGPGQANARYSPKTVPPLLENALAGEGVR